LFRPSCRIEIGIFCTLKKRQSLPAELPACARRASGQS
jgi:hypothetical protein